MSVARTRVLTGVLAAAAAYSFFAFLPLGALAPDALLTILCALALALAIVLVANRVRWSGRVHFEVWFVLLFLNLAAVAVEGTLFAPVAAPPSHLPANFARLLLASVAVAAIAAKCFGREDGIHAPSAPSRRGAAWVWRALAAALIYFVLYLVIGGINYSLVTQPYYAAHAGNLAVPAAQVVFVYEPIRGLLIALSVLPLTLAIPARTSAVAVIAGMLLFVVGGLVPLLPQSSLPLYLRVASLWEIFGQNFLTGVASAYLFVGWSRPGFRRATGETP